MAFSSSPSGPSARTSTQNLLAKLPLPSEPEQLRTITGSNVTLVPWEEAGDIYRIVDDIILTCRDELMQRYVDLPRDYTEDHAVAFLDGSIPAFARWAMVSGGRYCGNVEFRHENPAGGMLSIGYCASPWARGLGMTSEAVRLTTSEVIKLGATRIQLRTEVSNIASRTVAERAMYNFEGTLRQAVFRNNEFYDVAQYSFLAKDLGLRFVGAKMRG